MPELPEAETIARGLRAPLEGRRVREVRIVRPDVVHSDPAILQSSLPGRVISGVGRRGKNVVVSLDDGQQLVVNLGMSGRLLWREDRDSAPPPTHPTLEIHFEEGGGSLVNHDPRRFGSIRLFSAAAFQRWSESLGPEPLDPEFLPADFFQRLGKSRSPIRSWLLDQRRVAGVGNIYASEACHRAGIHPLTPANRIGAGSAAELHGALCTVLHDAVEGGGTTLRDYRTAQGWEGRYQFELRAYGREGEACTRCLKGRIVRIVFSNRSAFLCPDCQPAP